MKEAKDSDSFGTDESGEESPKKETKEERRERERQEAQAMLMELKNAEEKLMNKSASQLMSVAEKGIKLPVLQNNRLEK